jgi:hypothetical protein
MWYLLSLLGLDIGVLSHDKQQLENLFNESSYGESGNMQPSSTLKPLPKPKQ